VILKIPFGPDRLVAGVFGSRVVSLILPPDGVGGGDGVDQGHGGVRVRAATTCKETKNRGNLDLIGALLLNVRSLAKHNKE